MICGRLHFLMSGRQRLRMVNVESESSRREVQSLLEHAAIPPAAGHAGPTVHQQHQTAILARFRAHDLAPVDDGGPMHAQKHARVQHLALEAGERSCQHAGPLARDVDLRVTAVRLDPIDIRDPDDHELVGHPDGDRIRESRRRNAEM